MPLKTTCIGAYPKPDYVPITDWFQVGHDAEDYNDRVLRVWEQNQSPEVEALLDKATAEVVADQIACGIDVPTDGTDATLHPRLAHATDVAVAADDDALAIALTFDGGTRETRFEPSDSGLTVSVTIDSPQLPAPMAWSLDYARR